MARTSEHKNVVGKEHHLSMENWMGVVDNSQKISKKSPSSHSVNNLEEVDRITALYAEKSSPKKMVEMAKQRKRARNWERNENAHKTFTPPTSSLNIDLGGWISNAKILVPVTETDP